MTSDVAESHTPLRKRLTKDKNSHDLETNYLSLLGYILGNLSMCDTTQAMDHARKIANLEHYYLMGE